MYHLITKNVNRAWLTSSSFNDKLTLYGYEEAIHEEVSYSI